MKNIFRTSFCWLLLLGAMAACTTDDTTTVDPVSEANFVATASDGTVLTNMSNAIDNSYNIFEVGEVITFEDRSVGTANKITWTLDNGTFAKEVVANEDGVGIYAMMCAGDYSITMVADDAELIYSDYIQITGGQAPEPTEVDPAFTATYGGIELNQDSNTLNQVSTGGVLTLTDTSSTAGQYDTALWVFSNVNDATDYFEAQTVQGGTVECTLPLTTGTYNVTMYVSTSELTYSNYLTINLEYLAIAGYDCSFEDLSNTVITNLGMWWDASLYTVFDITQSSSQSHTGDNSILFNLGANSPVAFAFRDSSSSYKLLDIEGSTIYDVSFYVYIEEMDTAGSPAITADLCTWALSATQQLNTLPVGEWTKVTIAVTSPSTIGSATELMFRVTNTASSALKFYIDDMSLTLHVDEPTEPEEPEEPEGSTGNLFADAGYDCGMDGSGAWVYMWGISSENFTMTQSTSMGASNSTSVFFDVTSGLNAYTAYRNSSSEAIPVSVEADVTYDVTFNLYISQMGTSTYPSIDCGFSLNTSDWGQGDKVHLFDETTALNEWIPITLQLTPTSSFSDEILFRVINVNCDTNFQFYIDDLSMVAATVTEEPESSNDMLSTSGYECSFEDSSAYVWNAQTWMGYSAYGTITNSDAYAHTGSRSAYIALAAGEGLVVSYNDETYSNVAIQGIVGGKSYNLKYYVYIPSADDNATGSLPMTWLFDGQANNSGEWTSQNINLPSERDQWVEVNVTMSPVTDAANTLVVVTQNVGTASFNFYMDDLSLTLNE